MKTTKDFQQMKIGNEPIVMVTAYDYPAGKLAEQAGIDLLLVGDSLGMVALGYESTVNVTLEDMILHTKAVRRGAKDTFVVTDMPFMTYHSSASETLHHAKRLVQEGGAHAVKVEGSGNVVDMIKHLTGAGVPVVGHLGLTPQSVGVLGGYKVQCKTEEEANQLIEDAKAVEKAGAFAVVLECVPWQLAEAVTEQLSIPTIGIGAGPKTDGQVLVYHDLIDYGVERVAKFVKQYAHISDDIVTGLKTYVADVKQRAFPQPEHSFNTTLFNSQVR
ncbi:3-methyl-2-oxobutanoate hydroxymethyltransferase [Scopulibacillus daqui]|uniref:3-methyl-2-oxobutanoate hydroxymethyltransferase n=1 Tax=Scopulibacillus daqui TaxID=1469162 RepID=A0ABS2PYZ1_9BACL|nr:3-methyl-2-oxobutanoate hydroxymethyltransferase [Scopulibacillus daqui]MBM7645264.1 3-methyl-2-oxobutanoate hydroxymethyltransferase [Scopulibacillus daqui]